MQLPSKLYPYNQSSLALIPPILKYLEKCNNSVSVTDMYHHMKNHVDEPSDFLGVMDCLFLLGTIDLNEKGEIERC